MSANAALRSWRALTDEQRVLVHGQGADTRSVAEWRELVQGIATFGEVQRAATREAAVTSAVLLVVVAASIAWASVQADDPTIAIVLAGVAGVALVFRGGMLVWLGRRGVPSDVGRFTLPLLQTLEQDLGPDARLWFALRCVASQAPDERWLEGALALSDHELLHLSARDVLEDGGVVCWLRATKSQTPQLEVHTLGEDDPSASGITREVAAEAAAAGDPFTSTEMLALRTAHGIQLDMARLEAFEAMEVPAPPIGDVVAEASERTPGGRAHLASPEPLVALYRRATA